MIHVTHEQQCEGTSQDMKQPFYANHKILHGFSDGRLVEWAPGDAVELDDEADAEAIAHLRRTGALALPAELQSAEETTAALRRLEQERALLLAELEALRGEQEGQRQGQSAAASDAPAPSSKPASSTKK